MVKELDEGCEESLHYQTALRKRKKLRKNERIDGFPFNEPWPRLYSGRKYELILVDGEKTIGTVDDSRECMSEGLEWKTSDGNKEQAMVVAWRRIL